VLQTMKDCFRKNRVCGNVYATKLHSEIPEDALKKVCHSSLRNIMVHITFEGRRKVVKITSRVLYCEQILLGKSIKELYRSDKG
jgi:hypothetical protein